MDLNMKITKIIALITLLAGSTPTYSSGCPSPISVPFTNFVLNANCSVNASYSFGVNNVLFCYADAAVSTGIVSWPYQGSTLSAPAPLQLVNNSKYTGYPADPAGTIIFVNNSGTTMYASCALAL
jgi:hypothetical protein